jgi:hypothetical protein
VREYIITDADGRMQVQSNVRLHTLTWGNATVVSIHRGGHVIAAYYNARKVAGFDWGKR